MKACASASTCALLSLLLGAGCRTVAPHSAVPPAQRAQAAADAASAAARQVASCRDIALRAVDNALAVQREAEADLVEALRGEQAPVIDANRAAVDEAWSESGAALSLARNVAALAVEAAAGAQAATQAVHTLAGGTVPDAAAQDVVEQAESAAAAARNAAERAAGLTDQLKRKWLLPYGHGEIAPVD
jgi:hypothetical protein